MLVRSAATGSSGPFVKCVPVQLAVGACRKGCGGRPNDDGLGIPVST